MEIRGVRLKKVNREKKGNGFFVLRPPEYFSVPLQAGDFETSQRAVNVGEKVKEGSVIGRPLGRYGTYVYSPCSGKVVGVVKKLNARGSECEHIIIVRDLEEDKVLLPIIEEQDETQENLLKRLYESGIIDTFSPYDPAYKKYLLKCDIKKLVINCTEDDPYKTCDSALIENYTSEIVEGAKLLNKIAKAEKIVFIFTTLQSEVVKIVRNHLKKLGETKNITIKIYPNMYPLNNGRLIGYYETGKMVSDGMRTAQTSVIVDSPSNCYDFYLAVKQGLPCVQKAITIAGNNTLRKANYFVKNGTPINHILEVVQAKENTDKNMLIYGGIMSGIAQESIDVSVTLMASVILFCNEEEYATEVEKPCINCGRCVACCPVKLHVRNLDEAICDRRFGYAKVHGVEACIKCGACSYVCPSKRYLSQRLSFAKDLAEGKRGKNPSSSEYVLLEGEDVKSRGANLETDQSEIKKQISSQNQEIIESLSQLSKEQEENAKAASGNEGGENNE